MQDVTVAKKALDTEAKLTNGVTAPTAAPTDVAVTFDVDTLNQPIMIASNGGYDAYVPPMPLIDDVGAHPHS